MSIHFDVSEQLNIDENVITCPNCQARYGIAPGTLGARGREVKCAKCHQSWKAKIETSEEKTDTGKTGEDASASNLSPESEKEESALDAQFESVASETGSSFDSEQDTSDQELKGAEQSRSEIEANAKTQAKLEEDLERRKNLLVRTMPKARMGKLLRNLGIALLIIVSFSGLFLRENIVRTFPDLAGLYSAVGLGVNVVGLEFFEVKTIRALREGDEVMDISASISSVSSRQVSVPRILVTLLDENGLSVFEWSVTSRAAIMLPGEWIEFETQLISPPSEARSVRLAFERMN